MQYQIKGKSVAESAYKYYANDLSFKNFLYPGVAYGCRLHHLLQQKEQHRHQQRGEQVEGLAVLDFQDAQSGGGNQDATHDGDLRHQCIGDDVPEAGGNQVDGTLPAEEDGGGQHHADAVGGGQHGRGHQVQRGVGEEVGVVAIEGTHHGAYDGEGADAVEQDAGGEALRQPGGGVAGDEPLETPVDVEHRARQSAHGEADDEQHRILALGQMVAHGVEAQGQ